MEKITLSLTDFCETNEQELTCIFAESGMDRELDYNREECENMLYESKEYPQLIRTVTEGKPFMLYDLKR